METILSQRAGGKTTKMIEWLSENRNRVLLTYSNQEADRLKNQYPKLKESIYYWEVWLKDQYGKGVDVEVAVDNADILLQNHLQHPLAKITITKP